MAEESKQTLSKIELSDFSNMSGDWEPASEVLFRDIRGSLPDYTRLFKNNPDIGSYKNAFVVGPDFASTLINSGSFSVPTAAIPTYFSNSAQSFVMSDIAWVVSMGSTTSTPISYTTIGGTTSNIDLELYADEVITSNFLSTYLYKTPATYSGTPSWTAFGNVYAGTNHLLRSFGLNCYVTDTQNTTDMTTLNGNINSSTTTMVAATSGTGAGLNSGDYVQVDGEIMLLSGSGLSWTVTRAQKGTTATAHTSGAIIYDLTNGVPADRRLIKYFNTSYVLQAGLDLGVAWYVQDMIPYDNQYLAVFAEKATGFGVTNGIDKTTCFLWSGNPGNSPDYAIELEGLFAASICVNGVLYAFMNVNNDLVCYALNGLQFVEVDRFKFASCTNIPSFGKAHISHDGEYFYLVLTYGVSGLQQGVISWDVNKQNKTIVYKDNTFQPSLVLAFANPALPLIAKQIAGGYFQMNNMVPTQSTAVLNSNYIQIPEGRGAVKYIDILYNKPPQNVGDSIALSINYADDIFNIADTSLSLTSLISTNSDLTRSRLTVGVTCSRLYLSGTVTISNASLSSWIPAIYKIIIYYEPITTI